MKITRVQPLENGVLFVEAADGRSGIFDVRPYLKYPVFEPLSDAKEFAQVRTGGFFIEWSCGADLSADTVEARWQSPAVAKSV